MYPQVQGSGEGWLADHYNPLIVLREWLRNSNLGAKRAEEHTILTNPNQHSHTYPWCKVDGRVTNKEPIPNPHGVSHAKFPSKKKSKPAAGATSRQAFVSRVDHVHSIELWLNSRIL